MAMETTTIWIAPPVPGSVIAGTIKKPLKIFALERGYQ